MARVLRIACLLLVAAVAAITGPMARAAQDEVQFGSRIHVQKDATIHDAVCFFCSVDVDGTVDGSTVVFFGNVRINGQSNRDVVVFFGDVTAAHDTSIGNDLVNFFGTVELGPNVSVGHDTVVMFGGLDAADSVNIGGSRVVQPGIFFWGPVLVVSLGIYFLVHEVRASRRRRLMGGY